MLQLSYIRENKEEVVSRLAVKNFDAKEIVEKILSADASRRKIQTELDALNAEANSLAKQIGDLYKQGKKSEAEELKNKSTALKEKAKTLEASLASTEKELYQLLILLPNLPSPNVPKGKTTAENVIVDSKGQGVTFSFPSKPHWELAKQYNIIDFELGVKLTGAGFPVYIGKGAKLQRALINFFLDEAQKAGYTEIEPPVLVNENSGFGTGQLPDKDSQMYFVSEDKLYLIPTAEVPITNIYRDMILKEEQLPVKNCGYTPCFRREAGSYGKDVRGLNRLHQFDKVEIVQIAHPEKSYQVLEEMKNYVAGLIEKLGLPYRIVKLCGGDMSFASALTYDFEVECSVQQKWLEVSSVSNFETFQSNRSKIRFRDKNGKIQLAHTLNGSALALPRIVASLLENYQTKNNIKIPQVLHKYTGFEVID